MLYVARFFELCDHIFCSHPLHGSFMFNEHETSATLSRGMTFRTFGKFLICVQYQDGMIACDLIRTNIGHFGFRAASSHCLGIHTIYKVY